jgi:hypothetical protein
VVDARTGTPIAGAAVIVRSLKVIPSRAQLITADPQGRFTVQNLPTDPFVLDAAAPGFVPGSYGQLFPDGEPLTLPDGPTKPAQHITIRLWKVSSIAGRVSVEGGRAATRTRVFAALLGQFTPLARSRPRSVTTSDDGWYEFTGLASGEYLVFVGNPLTTVSQPQRDSLSPRLAMHVGDAWLSYGLAQDGTVQAWMDGPRLIVRPLTFYPSVDSVQSRPVELPPGTHVREIDLKWMGRSSAVITGRIVGTGDFSGVTVTAKADQAPPLPFDNDITTAASTVTDRTGTFRLLGMTPGTYRIEASRGPNDSAWASTVVTVGENTEPISVELALREGAFVTGRITPAPDSSSTGRLLRNAEVYLSRIGGEIGRNPRPSRVDADGTFSVGPLVPGRYVVVVSSLERGWMVSAMMSGGRDISGTALNVGAGGRDDLNLVLTDRPNVLEVSLDASWADPFGAVVLLLPVDRARWTDAAVDAQRFQQCSVRRNAKCVFKNVPAGDYYVAPLDADELAPNWRTATAMGEIAGKSRRVSIATPLTSVTVR